MIDFFNIFINGSIVCSLQGLDISVNIAKYSYLHLSSIFFSLGVFVTNEPKT